MDPFSTTPDDAVHTASDLPQQSDLESTSLVAADDGTADIPALQADDKVEPVAAQSSTYLDPVNEIGDPSQPSTTLSGDPSPTSTQSDTQSASLIGQDSSITSDTTNGAPAETNGLENEHVEPVLEPHNGPNSEHVDGLGYSESAALEPTLEDTQEQQAAVLLSEGESPLNDYVEQDRVVQRDLGANGDHVLALPESTEAPLSASSAKMALPVDTMQPGEPQQHLTDDLQHAQQEPHVPAPRPVLSGEESASREAFTARIKSSLLLQETMKSVNVSLQHKLSDLFRKRRAEDKSNEPDKSVTDQDQRFANVMTSLKQLRNEYDTMERTQQQIDQEFKGKLQDRKQEFSERSEEFRKYRRQIAVSSENSRTGKSIPLKVVEQLESQDSRKEAEVAAVRLENIKLRNKLKRHEQTLRQKEELAEGLHLIDFEQLKIENQTYNEKIEERNEELMKLRKKITNVVQVLAHIKEKLQFVQEENSSLMQDLTVIDEQVGKERDQLPVEKQQRDHLRSRNSYLKEKNGLLGNDALLRDYEQRVDEVQALKVELTQLKELYSQLTRTVKVQQAQAFNQAVLPLILN